MQMAHAALALLTITGMKKLMNANHEYVPKDKE